jgi:chemotaxis protein MotB
VVFYIFLLGFLASPTFAQQPLETNTTQQTTTTTPETLESAEPELLYTGPGNEQLGEKQKQRQAGADCTIPDTSKQAALKQQIDEGLKNLATCQKKQRQLAVLKDVFEQALNKKNKEETIKSKMISSVFNVIANNLSDSSAYRIVGNQLMISTDAILVPGRGEVSTKGKTRLQLVANALRAASALIPADTRWYWRVTGHADNQPLRRINWFPSNWELSAARAAAVLRYLIDQGISAKNISLAAFGSTRLLVPDVTEKADHAQNRRVEIELIIQ